MPNRCLAGNCSNVPDPSKNIKLLKFPKKHETEQETTMDQLCPWLTCKMDIHNRGQPALFQEPTRLTDMDSG